MKAALLYHVRGIWHHQYPLWRCLGGNPSKLSNSGWWGSALKTTPSCNVDLPLLLDPLWHLSTLACQNVTEENHFHIHSYIIEVCENSSRVSIIYKTLHDESIILVALGWFPFPLDIYFDIRSRKFISEEGYLIMLTILVPWKWSLKYVILCTCY